MSSIRLVALLLAMNFLNVSLHADVCVYKPPKVRLVSGTVYDSSGQSIPGVRVTIMRGGVAVATQTADSTGAFEFDSLMAGNYEIAVAVSGFRPAQYKVTLTRPRQHWGRHLRIVLALGNEPCGNVEVVENK
jgi:protocatechuate 3,4-dioxygenase beta subunit